MARRFKFFSRCDGVAAVEFALLAPLLILILCGIFDIGNVYYQIHTVNEAARVGARLAAVGGTPAQVTTAVQQFQQSGIILTTAPYMSPTNPVSGQTITVTVSTSVRIITPIISAFFPQNPFTYTGTCYMEME
ncbi:MAG: TadE/TadG family type IV pilus assembly protein [Dehalococcoidales bacterium]